MEALEDRCLLTTWVVTSAADSGPGTLRNVVAEAQSGDVIGFSSQLSGATIYLNSEIQINKSLNIGSTHTGVAGSGQNTIRLFEITSGDTNLDGLTLENGYASDGGAILIDSGATLNVAWDTFENNSAAYGGAIYNQGTLNVGVGTVFQDNTATSDGGAIENMNVLNIGLGYTSASPYFYQNTANVNGGAIASEEGGSGQVAINQTTFANNQAQAGDGGAIYSTDPMTFTTLQFTSNTATGSSGSNGSGGAVEVGSTSSLNDTSTTYSGNGSTGGNGGAIDTNGSVTLTTDTFSSNTSTANSNGNGGSGGAIEVDSNGTLNDTGSSYTSNVCNGGNGGAIETYDETTLTDDSFESDEANEANGNGGNGGALSNRITVDSGKMETVKSGSFDSLKAAGYGGAIIKYGSLTIVVDQNGKGIPFTNNTAGAGGGAISSNGAGNGNLQVTSATFYSNTAPVGGAINTDDPTTLTSCTFGKAGSINTATGGQGFGGAIDASPGAGTQPSPLNVNMCTFASNTAGASGGAISSSTTTDVEQSSFTGNQAANLGGAVYFLAQNASGGSLPSLTLNLDYFYGTTLALGNQALYGGAVYISAKPSSGNVQTNVTNDTFWQNSALGTVKNNNQGQGVGGGLFVSESTAGTGSGATAELINDTFFQNSSDNQGGGLALSLSDSKGQSNAKALLYSLTVYNNTAVNDSGGMRISTNLAGTVLVDKSIFSGNHVTVGGYTGPVDVTLSNANLNVFNTETYNLVGTSDSMFKNPDEKDPPKTDNPGLANTLALNGAPATYPPTLALSDTSEGYGTGDQLLGLGGGNQSIDERGFSRKYGEVCIGAEDPNAT